MDRYEQFKYLMRDFCFSGNCYNCIHNDLYIMFWWNFGFKLSTSVSNTSNSQTEKVTAIANTGYVIHMLPIKFASYLLLVWKLRKLYLVADHWPLSVNFWDLHRAQFLEKFNRNIYESKFLGLDDQSKILRELLIWDETELHLSALVQMFIYCS